MSTRRKPYDPSHSAAERKARDLEAARMIAQGATVRRDRGGHIISAFRSNVFNLLLARGSITQGHHDAAADLCQWWAEWKGLDGRDVVSEFVDNGRTPPDKRSLVTDRMVHSGRQVAYTLARLHPVSRLLIERLVHDSVEEDRPRVWRLQVQEAIGITVRDRQTKAVADALEELRLVVQGPRREAA